VKIELKTPAIQPFTEDDVRAYAEHLYEQSGRVPGRDLDNWLEAKACLQANVPREQSHRRLHEHLNGGGSGSAPKARQARPTQAARS